MRKFLLAAAGVAALASATAMAQNASPNTPGNTGVGDKINSSAFSAFKEGAMAANPPPETPAKAAQPVPK